MLTEREVLHLIALGLSNQEITGQLHIAEQTVKTHVSPVLSKLDLRDRVEAVVLGEECGVVCPASDRRAERVGEGDHPGSSNTTG